MHYALRVYLAHHDRASDAFLKLFEALEEPARDARIGRTTDVLVPVRHAADWKEDFLFARSMHATAGVDGLTLSIRCDYAPFATVLVEVPTEREDLAVAITTRLTGSLDVDFGVLQRIPEAAPMRLDTDADRLAYLALASVNLVGERYESTGPIAPGTRTLVSARVAAQARSSLRLDDLQGLSLSSVAALQASGIGATFSQAPNGRRLLFTKGPQWVPPPRTQISDARDPAARRLEERLALSAKEQDLVDFEEPEIATGTSLLFLTAPDARAEMLGLEGSALRWSLLDRATLSESAFIDCDLRGSSLAATRLLEVRVERSRASHVSFRDAVVAGCTFEACDLRATNFASAAISNTEIRDCDLRGAIFAETTFERTTFDGCRLDVDTVDHIQSRGATVR